MDRQDNICVYVYTLSIMYIIIIVNITIIIYSKGIGTTVTNRLPSKFCTCLIIVPN